MLQYVTFAGVAQLVERSLRKGLVVGSNPSTSFYSDYERIQIYNYKLNITIHCKV